MVNVRGKWWGGRGAILTGVSRDLLSFLTASDVAALLS